MGLTGTRTYVGFGFGAIQAGLLLHEAYRSGNFRRLVVAEVLPDVVAAVRGAGGHYAVNIAHADRIETARNGPIEIADPGVAADREQMIEAVSLAEELGTAVPSVKFYVSPGPGSLHRLLAEGLRRKAARGGPRAVLYAAENHNHAAEILEAAVWSEVPETERAGVRAQVRFLNTVVGKMSGLAAPGAVALPEASAAAALAPVTPGGARAFLVEAFNRILITRVDFGAADGTPFRRGIEVFEEKPDLLPFEEAKLYGHNATHALAAYLAALLGVRTLAELRGRPGMLEFLRAAFVQESGAALVKKYAGLDPLFTPAGYRAYAEDLLVRMTNPYLMDAVERVARDPQRKLGWDDRLVGTLRLALGQGIAPRRFAVGAAAALVALNPAVWDETPPQWTARLLPLWDAAHPDAAERGAVLRCLSDGLDGLRRWRAAGQPELERFFGGHGAGG